MCTVPYIDYCRLPMHISALPRAHAWQWSSVSGYWSSVFHMTLVTQPALSVFTVGGRRCFSEWEFLPAQHSSRNLLVAFMKYEIGDDGWILASRCKSAWFQKPPFCWRWVESGLLVAFQVSSSADGSSVLDEMFMYTCLIISLIKIWARATQSWVFHPNFQVCFTFILPVKHFFPDAFSLQ